MGFLAICFKAFSIVFSILNTAMNIILKLFLIFSAIAKRFTHYTKLYAEIKKRDKIKHKRKRKFILFTICIISIECYFSLSIFRIPASSSASILWRKYNKSVEQLVCPTWKLPVCYKRGEEWTGDADSIIKRADNEMAN